MLSRRSLLSALFLAPCSRLLSGQQASPQQAPAGQPPPNYSADVKVVNLFAIVRDKKGKIVNNLTKDDFVLDEDGHPQTIKFFAQESDLPLTLGLMVDTSPSQRTVLDAERTASQKFFDQVLRQDRDLAFVIHFDYEVELLQDLTPSHEKLEKALDLLQIGQRPNQQQQGGNNPNDPNGNPGQYPGGGYPGGGYPGGGYPRRRYPGGGYPGGGYPSGGGRAGGTKLYDSILLASDELMKKQQGRKALVLLTDGVDRGSKTTLYQAIASAQRSDTLVYSVLFEGSQPSPMGFGGMGRRPMGGPGYGGGENGKKVLQQIAQETGGGFFQVSHSHPIDKIYETIQDELRNQYNLGYTSDQPPSGGVYRHIHLAVKNKGMVVQARDGYYPS
jgi:VWFA-related protein